MTDLVLPLAFWAETQADAEAQALAWAAKEPRIAAASIQSIQAYTHQPTRWTVVLDVTWKATDTPQPLELGL